jgi:hypothetical protein
MGWLFKRKRKVPKIPFPEAMSGEDGTLKFPENSGDRVIEPEDVKDAAGLGGEMSLTPDMEDDDMPTKQEEMPMPSRSVEMPRKREVPVMSNDPLYVKVDVYQRILGEIGNLKGHLLKLGETNRGLENSEYNEEANFDKLRKSMKAMHDRLLKADKVLFK